MIRAFCNLFGIFSKTIYDYISSKILENKEIEIKRTGFYLLDIQSEIQVQYTIYTMLVLLTVS